MVNGQSYVEMVGLQLYKRLESTCSGCFALICHARAYRPFRGALNLLG